MVCAQYVFELFGFIQSSSLSLYSDFVKITKKKDATIYA